MDEVLYYNFSVFDMLTHIQSSIYYNVHVNVSCHISVF